MKTIAQLSMIIAVLLSASSGWGCFLFPRNYKINTVKESEDIFFSHDGENAHMVIRTTLRAEKLPKEIAWVLPISSLPSKYEEIAGPFFNEVNYLFPDTTRGLEKGYGGGGVGAKLKRPGIKIHETVTSEQYVIQPIEILKDNSTDELNAWLTKNKFKQINSKISKAYFKKGSAFLAIRMQMNKPGAELVSHSLHITYKTDQLSVPVNFSPTGTNLDLNIYVFSHNELKKEFKNISIDRVPSVAYENKGLNPFVDDIIGKQKGFVTLYKANDLSSKSEDPMFLASEL